MNKTDKQLRQEAGLTFDENYYDEEFNEEGTFTGRADWIGTKSQWQKYEELLEQNGEIKGEDIF